MTAPGPRYEEAARHYYETQYPMAAPATPWERLPDYMRADMLRIVTDVIDTALSAAGVSPPDRLTRDESAALLDAIPPGALEPPTRDDLRSAVRKLRESPTPDCPRCGDPPEHVRCSDPDCPTEAKVSPSPDREAVEWLCKAADKLAAWAEEANGHHGCEECARPTQPDTEWDEVQYGLRDAAADVRAALSDLESTSEEER